MIAEERFENQHGIIATERLQIPFKIIGAGAIGGFFTMPLAKMGAQDIEVWDNDTLEEHNFSNQLYPTPYLDEKKVVALESVVHDFSGVTIKTHSEHWKGEPLRGFVVSAVDNMDVRKKIWDACKLNKDVKWFLDGRMGAQVFRTYLINPHDTEQIAFYERNLYSSDQATPEQCGAQSIIYTVLTIAGIMLSLVKKALGANERRIPKEIVYDHVNCIFTSAFEVQTPVEPDEQEPIMSALKEAYNPQGSTETALP